MSRSVEIVFAKVEEERRLVYGPVLIPDVVDAQEDVITAAEIEKAAHEFMLNYRSGHARLDDLHKATVKDEQAYVVESWIVPEGNRTVLGSHEYEAGTWLLGVKILDDAIWARVKSGELRGFSAGGISTAWEIEET